MSAIDSGEWQSDQQLPNESQLAESFGISKITVRQACRELVDAGYIRREQGRGTFVSNGKLAQGPRELTSFTEEMRRHNLVAASRVLRQLVSQADPKMAGTLHLREGDPVFILERLRLADGEPMGIQTAHIPLELVPGLRNETFENASLYDALQSRYGLYPARAKETHCAALAEPGVAELLGIAAGSPVFIAERVTLLSGGRPFEFVTSVMRGDRYRIVLDLVKGPRAAKGATLPS